MNFANVTTIKIPNGEVLKIQETSNGRVLWQKKSIPKDISVFTNHPGVYNATNVDGLFKYINNLPQIQSLKRLNEYSLILRCKESDNIYCMGTNLNLRVLPGTNFPKEDKVTRIPNTFNLYNDPRLIPPSCLNPDPEKRIKDIAYFEDDSIHRYVFLRGYSPQLRETVYTPPMDDTRYNIWEFAVGLSAKLQKSNNSEDMFVLLDELYKIQDGIYYTGYVFAAMSSIKYCTDMRCTYDNKVRHLKKIDYPLALDYDGNVYDITKATYKANVYFVLTTAITNLNVNTIGKVIDCYVSESTNFKFLLNERFELYALGYNGKYNLGLPSPQNYNTYTYVGTYSKLKKLVVTDDVTLMLMNDGTLYIAGTPTTITRNILTNVNNGAIYYQSRDISLLPESLNRVYQGFTRILNSYYIYDIEIYFNSLVFIAKYIT